MANLARVAIEYNQLALRQRVIVLVAFLSFMYLCWFLIFSVGLDNKIKFLKNEYQYAQKQAVESAAQLTVINDSDIKVLQEELADIAIDTQKIDDYLSRYLSLIISTGEVVDVVRDILSIESEVIVDAVKLMPIEKININIIDPLDQPSKDVYLYKQNIVINVRGEYFDIQEYLEKLEDLRWRLFAEHLIYEVSKYPEANLDLVLYVFSTGRGGDD